MTAQPQLDFAAIGDLELARLCAAGDGEAARHLLALNNQRLFRAAWSILRNRSEAEDAVQAAYVAAFGALDRFEGKSSLSTWLTRIVLNEALGRLRRQKRRQAQLEDKGVTSLDTYRETLMRGSEPDAPDAALAREQVRSLLEKAIADLPEAFRTVFVMGDVEGLSVEDTAEVLGIPAATVKTRRLRARRRLQQSLAPEVRQILTGVFPFAGADCAALTERVLGALAQGSSRLPSP